jgi:hypothetical protein
VGPSALIKNIFTWMNPSVFADLPAADTIN